MKQAPTQVGRGILAEPRLTGTVRPTILAFFLLCLVGCKEQINRVEWTTMGTVAAVQWRGTGDDEMKRIVEEVKRTFTEIETLLNAHSPTSEISRLALLADEEVLAKCHPLVKPCYETAFQLQSLSMGAFNPRWRGPKTLDLGGIAKGFALDVAAKRIRSNVKRDLLLDLGGNLLAVRGTWRTGVYGTSETIELTAGESSSTSAAYFRGKHIRDGRTGQPVTNNVKSVTVVSPDSAAWADGFSTFYFILGRPQKKIPPQSKVIWVMKDGSVKRNPL